MSCIQLIWQADEQRLNSYSMPQPLGRVLSQHRWSGSSIPWNRRTAHPGTTLPSPLLAAKVWLLIFSYTKAVLHFPFIGAAVNQGVELAVAKAMPCRLHRGVDGRLVAGGKVQPHHHDGLPPSSAQRRASSSDAATAIPMSINGPYLNHQQWTEGRAQCSWRGEGRCETTPPQTWTD